MSMQAGPNFIFPGDPRMALPGAVSLQEGAAGGEEQYLSRLFDEPITLGSRFGTPGVVPWRIPFRDIALFHDDMFRREAIKPSGVRIRFRTDATSIVVHGKKIAAGHRACPGDFMDLCVDNKLIATSRTRQGETRFDALPAGMKTVEIWLCPAFAFCFEAVEIDPAASLLPLPEDKRPVWMVYGSSHTLAVRAHSPAQTWPAIVARARNWNLVNLGYGGECKLDPVIARMIRDAVANFICLELGANCFDASFSNRTFPAALIGMILTIRDRHPHTPLLVCSPIHMRAYEESPGASGMSAPQIREHIHAVVSLMQQRGDTKIFEFNGLDLFDAACTPMQPDGSHPDGDGNHQLAENFLHQLGQPGSNVPC